MIAMKIRRFLCLVCALALTAGLLCPLWTQADETDTVYVRKHISLVYDNSRSMIMDSSLKWCYASYAAQVFTGLLNDTDSLSITFMNNSIANDLTLDLQADRQAQVNRVLDATDVAHGGTPFSSVQKALDKLESKGLLSDAALGDGEVDESQQYWLVLTTDGQFDSYEEADVVSSLSAILDDYSNLQVVYFGIGTQGSASALDLRANSTLSAYANFTAYYVADQDQIVSTMQEMSNRISGRYDVKEDIAVSGSTVTLSISGESSPIRNIAVLAQQTNARLISAVAEDGTQLEISRAASIAYPHNSGSSYTNVPAGTLGGYTAMITSPTGKIPEGNVTLTFDQAVNETGLSLMYEPAIYVRLTVQKQVGSQWVDVPMGERVSTGDTLRLQYAVCEDGSNKELDASRLPGRSEARFTCGDRQIQAGEAFTIPAGNTTVSATVSLMDGAYQVSTSRTIRAVDVSEYRVTVSDALTILDTDLAENTGKHLDFTVKLGSEALTEQELSAFRLDTGTLQGEVSRSGSGTLRFAPRQTGCAPGDYTVTLYFGDTVMASQTVTVITTSYSATASGSLSLLTEELAENRETVDFAVTVHQGADSRPLTREEADSGDFRLDTGDLEGSLSFENGSFRFLPNDPATPAGDYGLTLYHRDTVLATATVTVLPVTYSATADRNLELIDAQLSQNTEAVTFTVTVRRGNDTMPITEAEADLFTLTAAASDGTVLEGRTDFADGKLVFTPGGTAPVGEYTLALVYEGATLAQAKITVIPDPVTYTAEADRELTLFSNEIGTNREPITFAVTAHRSAGDSPITQEEAEGFQITAADENGAVLNGTVQFTEGSLVFTPQDPNAAVGSYTVELSRESSVLATSTVTILQYNAQYSVEVHVPDPAEIRRYDLISNENAIAFVVRADGEPCSVKLLEAMVQDMIALTWTPDALLMDVEITAGYWEGTPAILVRPTSWTDIGLLDSLVKPFGVLGLLPMGDFQASLVVNAPKGASGTGSLAFTSTAMEELMYLIILVVEGILLALLLAWIVSNVLMYRFEPGTLKYYCIDTTSGQYSVVIRDEQPLPTRNSLPFLNGLPLRLRARLRPSPETATLRDLRFTAQPTSVAHTRFSFPSFVLTGDYQELAKYRKTSRSEESIKLLQLLEESRITPLTNRAVEKNDDSSPLVEKDSLSPEERKRMTVTDLMRAGTYIRKDSLNMREYWTFVPKPVKTRTDNGPTMPRKSKNSNRIKKARKIH